MATCWVAIATFSIGCASVPAWMGSGGAGNSAEPGVAIRPDLTVDYDVLVAEMALADGDYPESKEAFLRAIEKDPNSAYLELRLSRVCAQIEDLPGAIQHARRAVELDPEEEESRLLLGGLYRIAGDVDSAESVLLRDNGEPFGESSALLIYQIYFETDRLEDALGIAEKLVADRPEMLGGFMALATIYEHLGQPDEAERVLREALALHPDRFVLYTRLARLARKSGDRLGVIAVYREALERRANHYGSLLSLGEALVSANDVDGAIETYGLIVENFPNDTKALLRLASLYFAAGRQAEAATILEDAWVRFPEHYELAFSLGQVLRGMEKQDRAREVFEQIPLGDHSYVEARAQIISILEAEKEYALALEEVKALRKLQPSRSLDYHAAGLHLRVGEVATGRAILEKILEENPDDEEALYQLGVFHGMAKNTNLAIETMQRVLEINPDNAHALNYIGYTWAERGENLDEAEDLIVRALEKRPNDGFIADSLGWVYYMRGRDLLAAERSVLGKEFLLRAREQLTLAAELTGGDPVVSEHLGDVYRILDEKERAYQLYQEAVDMNHREDEQPHLLDKLDVLRRELADK